MRPKLRKTYNKNARNFSYICQLKEKSRKKLCTCKNIDGITTDKLIIQKIKEIKVDTKKIKNYLKKKKIEVKANPKIKYQNNKNKINNLIEKLAYTDKDLAQEIIEKIKEIKKENNSIENLINKTITKEKARIIAEKLLKNHMFLFTQLDTVNQKHLINKIINTIEYDNNTLYINYKDTKIQ